MTRIVSHALGFENVALREIILHIGRHKSGTSSLQHCLAQNRSGLDAQGVLYPHSGAKNRIAHHAVVHALHPRSGDETSAKSIAMQISDELQPHHERLLLSSEAFQNIVDLSLVRSFVQSFGSVDVRIVVYFRERLDYAMSSFRQMVQNQSKFATFAQHTNAFRQIDPFLNRWSKMGQLCAKWFDRNSFKGGDVIADFSAETDITLEQVLSQNMNPSIGGNLLVYKLAANKLGSPAPSYNLQKQMAEDHAPFRAPFYVSDADALRVRTEHSYNDTLRKRLGDVQIKSFSGYQALPCLDTLDSDVERIASVFDVDQQVVTEMRNSAKWFQVLS